MDSVGPGSDERVEAVLEAVDVVVDALIQRLTDERPGLREQLGIALRTTEQARYCRRLDPATHAQCDRPARHTGDCSWAVDQVRRRYREYEEQAVQAFELARQLQVLQRQHQALQRRYAELDQLVPKHARDARPG